MIMSIIIIIYILTRDDYHELIRFMFIILIRVHNISCIMYNLRIQNTRQNN